MRINIPYFRGMAPKVEASKLTDSQAQEAVNCEPWSGALKAITEPFSTTTLSRSGTIRSIYQLGSTWCHWNEEVDMVKGPVASDTYDRFYYTGHKVPKVVNETLATTGGGTDYPLTYYQLGIPAPETAPTVTPSGGSGAADTRSYIYTFVSEWGEEGAPSNAGTATGKVDDTWALTNLDAAPLNAGTVTNAVHSAGVVTVTVSANHLLRTGEYVTISGVVGMTDLNAEWKVTRLSATTFSVVLTTAQTYTSGGSWAREANLNVTNMTKRIYRTVSNIYQFVAEIAVATTSYNDTAVDADLGETITSTDYEMPPTEMQGLVVMPNGVLAGFINNEVYFCEPFQPHAWPSGYSQSVNDNVVALGALTNSIIVATDGWPRIITGIHPANMSATRINLEQPCVSKPSMVHQSGGYLYASKDGLVAVDGSGARLITNHLAKKEDWALYNPSSIRSAYYDNRTYMFYEDGGEENNVDGGLVFDALEPEAELVKLSATPTALWRHPNTQELYIVEDHDVGLWDGGAQDYTVTWKSKRFIIRRKTHLRAAKVHFEFVNAISQEEYDAALAAEIAALEAAVASFAEAHLGALGGFYVNNFTVNGGPYLDIVQGLDLPANLVFNLYADGTLRFSKSLVDEKAFRLPDNFPKYDNVELEISGSQALIRNITVAETMGELSKV